MRNWRHWLMAMILAVTASVAGAFPLSDFTIHPPAPLPFEPVTLRYKNHFCNGIDSRVARVGADYVVTFTWTTARSCLPTIGTFDEELRLGAYPAGSYTVVLADPDDVIPAQTPTQLEFTVRAPPDSPSAVRPRNDYSGHWWNPFESGWGLSVHQSATDQMMVVFYVYDAGGQPLWYVAPGGRWLGKTVWEGTLYRTKVPPLFREFDPSRVERVEVGTARLDFGWGRGLANFPNIEPAAYLTYFVDGVQHNKWIQKLQF